jgi:hypothetical protein
LPGTPTTRELSGISLPSAIKALAPIIQFDPITAPLSIVAPMPISALSRMVQP